MNVPEWEERAHFLQEKGTDRRLVLNGVKNKYSWVDKGSSYLLSNILAAVLYGQLEEEENIKAKRALITKAYKELFTPFHEKGLLQMMSFPTTSEVNHHAFWVIFNQKEQAVDFMAMLREYQVAAYIGYIPLHSSPMGKKLGYHENDLPLTEDLGNRIVRMPFYTELAEMGLEHCIASMQKVLTTIFKLA